MGGAVLQTAVKFIGYPYVWGGESERPRSPYGAQAQGGFDCSGFVWRVYKLQSYAGGTALADHAARPHDLPDERRGPAQRSGSRSRSSQPADVVFFGADGPRSKPAQVNHMGIYLGNGWFIHSSERRRLPRRR